MKNSVDTFRRFNNETAVPSVTAVFLYSKSPSKRLSSVLQEIKNEETWKLVVDVLDVKKSESFRVVRTPVLLLYNEKGVETARVIGEEHIISNVRRLLGNE